MGLSWGAGGLEATALAVASLGTILPGGEVRVTLEAILLLSTEELGEAWEASGMKH